MEIIKSVLIERVFFFQIKEVFSLSALYFKDVSF